MNGLVVLTAGELAAKGITKRDVEAMLRRAEKRCNWFAKKHIHSGVSTKEQAEWDAACARWDHLKATVQVLS